MKNQDYQILWKNLCFIYLRCVFIVTCFFVYLGLVPMHYATIKLVNVSLKGLFWFVDGSVLFCGEGL